MAEFALKNDVRCGCATLGISHLGLSSQIPYIDTDSHTYSSTVHPHIHLFPPHSRIPTLSFGDESVMHTTPWSPDHITTFDSINAPLLMRINTPARNCEFFPMQKLTCPVTE